MNVVERLRARAADRLREELAAETMDGWVMTERIVFPHGETAKVRRARLATHCCGGVVAGEVVQPVKHEFVPYRDGEVCAPCAPDRVRAALPGKAVAACFFCVGKAK